MSVPNALHHDYVKSALESGKHVVVEKPFVESHNLAKQLFDLAEAQHKVLRVFHNRKYDGDFMTVQKLLEENSLGDVISLTARFDRFRATPKDGWRNEAGVMSGVFYDLGAHLFHYAVSLFGLPKSIYCDILTDHPGLKTDDHFEAELYYDTHRVHLGAEQFARHQLPKFHIKGLKGSYVKKGFDTPEFVEQPIATEYQSGLFSKLYKHSALESRDVPVQTGAHYTWYDVLADDIRNRALFTEETAVSLAVIKAMEAAIKSHEQKKRIQL